MLLTRRRAIALMTSSALLALSTLSACTPDEPVYVSWPAETISPMPSLSAMFPGLVLGCTTQATQGKRLSDSGSVTIDAATPLAGFHVDPAASDGVDPDERVAVYKGALTVIRSSAFQEGCGVGINVERVTDGPSKGEWICLRAREPLVFVGQLQTLPAPSLSHFATATVGRTNEMVMSAKFSDGTVAVFAGNFTFVCPSPSTGSRNEITAPIPGTRS